MEAEPQVAGSSREVAFLFGHFGSMRQRLRAPMCGS